MRHLAAVIICLLGFALLTPDAGAQDVVWAEGMGGVLEDTAKSIAVDRSGNAYVAGSFRATAQFGPYSLTSAGGTDIFVVKLSKSGSVQWAKRMGSDDIDRGSGIAVDHGGNAYVTGRFRGTADFGPHSLTSGGGDDVFVAKLDTEGTVQWARRMGGTSYYDTDYGYGIAVDRSGNVYVTGFFEGTAEFGSFTLTSSGTWEIFVTKLDTDGTVQWATGMGGASATDVGYGIAVDADGNSYVTGRFDRTADFGPFSLTSAGGRDIFVTKLDHGGNVLWAARMGGGTWHDEGRGIAVDTNGNAYVTGYFQGTGDFGAYSLTSAGSDDIFVTRFDSDGSVRWAKRMGGDFDDRGAGITMDDGGNAYLTGVAHDLGDFGSYSPPPEGNDDVFVVELDADGTVQWVSRMAGDSVERGNSIAVSEDGSLYVAGIFQGPADFGSHHLTPADLRDLFVLRLRKCGYLADRSSYGRLLFSPLCTRDATTLPQDAYDSTTIGIHGGTEDAFFLSSDGTSFAPLAVDDEVHCDGQNVGLGPYEYRPDVPPFDFGVPIELNLVPLPAHRVPAEFIVEGNNALLFELLDTQGEIHGNTAVYLVRDCGIYLEDPLSTQLNWVSHDVEIEGFTSNLDVVSGVLSDLLEDRDFSRACFLGTFVNATQAIDSRPGGPPAGQGYYYLVSGTCAAPVGYGDSHLDPDPRDTLPPGPNCP